jgi:small subunit ribosomal protein S3
MIERKIVNEKLQEYLVQEFVSETLKRVGHAKTEVVKTPVGEKIVVHASRPGLIVGSKGANIKKLTKVLKTKFKFDNPQVDIQEVPHPSVNATLVAENIAYQLEKYGSQRFKAVGYQAMEGAIKGGALGIEIVMSGKIPSARAKTWRFYLGYLKKSGDIAVSQVDTAYMQASLKSGIIGIQVRILPSNIILPDTVTLYSECSEITAPAKVVSPTSIMDEAPAQKPAEATPAKKAKKAPAKHSGTKAKKAPSKVSKASDSAQSDQTQAGAGSKQNQQSGENSSE